MLALAFLLSSIFPPPAPSVHIEAPIIHVTTPDGPATISGPGAEWLLEVGFPVVE